MDRIVAVNQLSREIVAGTYEHIEDAEAQLEAIRRMPGTGQWKQILASGAGSGFFCVLFGGGVLDCVSAMLAVLLRGETGHAYNISNPGSIVTIRQMAQAFADAAGVSLAFDNPTDAEAKSYNLMDNSALNASALEALGWYGLFDLASGVQATLDAMK
jgi:uncharacterized membrane protein YjjP (DUF1212 family)